MDAITMLIEYLEKDIEFDQDSDIKNKQLKDILFHEKSRILQKAKFFKKNYEEILKSSSCELDEQINNKRQNCEHDWKGDKYDQIGVCIQMYCENCGKIKEL